MKIKITLLCLLITLGFSAKAQNYVTIPDANFVAYLQTNFPTCMNGNQMDTTCAGIKNATDVYVQQLSISNLYGIQYFSMLKILNCGNNSYGGISQNWLTALPTLPNSIQELYCSYNQLTSLPTLPISLQNLMCSNNQLTNLPTLPNSLTSLSCENNHLTNLPTLPNLLTILTCANNQLTSLPTLPNSCLILNCEGNLLTSLTTLPNLLQRLYCGANHLTSLPVLPNSLQRLNCSNNQLTSLPVLPPSITEFDCNTNLLTSLPTLPNAIPSLICHTNQLTRLPTLPSSLQSLICYKNQLTSLPNLPSSLQSLICHTNQLTSLPTLPDWLQTLTCNTNQLTSLPILPTYLQSLICNNNSISCFPTFPNSLSTATQFKISSNPFTCLPNYVTAMNPLTLAYPLCIDGDLVNNYNGCISAKGILGTIYKDKTSNCVFDASDLGCNNIRVMLLDTGNNLIAQTYSFNNGTYYFPDTIGIFTVKIDTANAPFSVQCMFPGIDSVITTTNTLVKNVNFGVTCKPGFDIGVQSIQTIGRVFPGLQHRINLNAGDISNWIDFYCGSGVGGQVQITVTGPVTYNGIASGALTPSINGNVYTYTIANFGTINNSTAFNLLFTTDTSAQAGDQICVNVAVTPTVGDNNMSNNNYQFCYQVSNSYDPNKKEVYPIDVQPGFNDYFTYTVHFQNTGTAPAMNIRLTDTLDANLDLETFQVINYSHYNTASVKGNVLTFHFPNIQLPDSTSNLEGSQGFVQYRIKPKANLPVGTKIKNTANIYFDYNPVIVTNTTTNEYTLTASLNEKTQNTTLSIYPNPSNGKYLLSITDVTDVSKLTIEVRNVMGEILLKTKMQNNVSQIDLSAFANGIYFVQINGSNQSLNQRIIKQ